MSEATKITGQPIFVDTCARCDVEVLHWYEQAGFGQALATMSSDPQIQGFADDRFVVCPACRSENAVVSMPGSENHGGREAIVGLRAQN